MFEFLQESLYENDINYIDKSFNILSECKSYFETGIQEYDYLYETAIGDVLIGDVFIGDVFWNIIEAIENFFERLIQAIKERFGKNSLNSRYNKMKKAVRDNRPLFDIKVILLLHCGDVLNLYRNIVRMVMQSNPDDIDIAGYNSTNKYTQMINKFNDIDKDIYTASNTAYMCPKNIKSINVPVQKVPDFYKSILDIEVREVDKVKKITKKIAKELPPDTANKKVKALMEASTKFTNTMNGIAEHTYRAFSQVYVM